MRRASAKSTGVMEGDAKRVPPACPDLADAMPEVHPVGPAGAPLH